jgi:hypothetical protein
MPAGARPAYMGIHGGTMPVSLLVVADGSSLLGFVGRSGNDFLDVLRNAKSSFSTSRILDRDVDGQTANDSNNAASPAGESPAFDKIPFPPNSLFVTGSGLTSLPVIQMNGSLAVFSSNLERLLPFGFSENPLPIEGEITPPAKMPPKPRYRLIFEPQYLHPR